jgi:(p)ppGpp synthase/HD superfamily hydrolase
LNRIDEAIEFASLAHKSQFRKGTDIPYISHPFGVAMLLQQAKCEEEVILAGLLHDTLEDTDTTEEDIRSRFGPTVLELVIAASEPDKSASWEERKQHTLEFLKHAKLEVNSLLVRISCIICVPSEEISTSMEMKFGASSTEATKSSDGIIQA